MKISIDLDTLTVSIPGVGEDLPAKDIRVSGMLAIIDLQDGRSVRIAGSRMAVAS